MDDTRLVIEGVPELRKMLREVGGRELEKELGQVHKRIGEMVISAAGGRNTGVGEGAGASIRPSASVREVLLRVGGSHRDMKARQWGRRQIWPGGQAPSRPYLIGAAVKQRSQILDQYDRSIRDIIRRVGFRDR